ncbi:copper resistance D family protein [Actinomadura atramentaria]|uniref:copper resistance D family protein n=1 Tax=Actinomadura atramentaria TaxID=1990 RepID=UPI00036D57A8|nr:CopD family protein [Actinomadura atramentaria]
MTGRALTVAAATLVAFGGLALGISATETPDHSGMAMTRSVTEIVLPAARLVGNIAGVAAAGLALLLILLAGTDEALAAGTRRAATGVGVCWTLATACALWLQAAEISPLGYSVTGRETIDYATHVTTGRALLVTLAAAATYALLNTASRTLPAIPLLVAAVGLIAVPLTGHLSQSSQPLLGRASIAAHVLAAALWVGGLGAIFLLAADDRNTLATALPRFSKLAAVCITAVAISGALIAYLRLEPDGLFDNLFTTGYGFLILAKTACLIALASTGNHIRRRILPAVLTRHPTALPTWAGAELTLMTLTLALGTVLARSSVT